jgi:heme A synthase
MPSRNPLELAAWFRRARPAERRAFLCILAAILVGILGLWVVEDGSAWVLVVALVIVALIMLGGWFHHQDAPPR